MSARLTRDARSNIVERVMNYKYAQSDAEQLRLGAVAFDRIADLAQGHDKNRIESLDSLYFQKTDVVRVRVGKPGCFEYVDLVGHYPRAWKQGWPQRYEPINGYSGDSEYDDQDIAPFPKEAAALAIAEAKRALKYQNEKTALRSKLVALVHSVSTYKKLYEVWPELAEIVPPDDDRPTQMLSVDVKELNRLIPLPAKSTS